MVLKAASRNKRVTGGTAAADRTAGVFGWFNSDGALLACAGSASGAAKR